MRIREKDIGRAKVDDDLDPEVPSAESPDDLWGLVCGRLDQMGAKIRHRRSEKIKHATTFKRQVRVPSDFDDWSTWRKAFLIVHENVHLRQWRRYHVFGIRYTFSERFRWAVEVAARREQIRALVAVGANHKVVEDWISKSIDSLVRLSSFVLLEYNDVKIQTRSVLFEELRCWNGSQA